MNDFHSVEVGDRIKKQRQLLGYSREKLAEMVDITPRFCYDLELGLKKMSVPTLTRLSSALNVSVDYLLTGSDEIAGEYTPIIGLIKTCPIEKLDNLEQIVFHYIQAVKEEEA